MIRLNSTRAKLCEARNITCDSEQTASELIQNVILFKETLIERSGDPIGFRLPLTRRLLVIWALALPFVSSAFVVQSVRKRLGLKQALDKAEASSSQQAYRGGSRQQPEGADDAGGDGIDAYSSTRGVELTATSGEDTHDHASNSNGHPQHSSSADALRNATDHSLDPRRGEDGCAGACFTSARRRVVVQLLKLLEASFAWVSGCAMVAAASSLVGTLETRPNEWYVAGFDLLFSTVLNLLAIIWLRITSTGGDSTSTSLYMSDEQKSTSRYALEIDFYTGAFSFCVGWGYIVVLRDVTYRVASDFASFGTTDDNDGKADSDKLAQVGQITSLVLILGVTAVLLVLQEKGLPKPLVRAVTTPIEQVTRWWSGVSSGRRRTSPIVRMNGGSSAGLLQHAVPQEDRPRRWALARRQRLRSNDSLSDS